jgi:hypothetical protein
LDGSAPSAIRIASQIGSCWSVTVLPETSTIFAGPMISHSMKVLASISGFEGSANSFR